eukprot:4063524-Prymnesium_polylepis.1
MLRRARMRPPLDVRLRLALSSVLLRDAPKVLNLKNCEVRLFLSLTFGAALTLPLRRTRRNKSMGDREVGQFVASSSEYCREGARHL